MHLVTIKRNKNFAVKIQSGFIEPTVAYRNRHFYVWNPNLEGNPEVKLITIAEDILPSKICYARLSLDGELLAIQLSTTQILIIHINSKKRWKIEIKSPEENRILNLGIVWSEHGGNSQDLVIITAYGLELYKISSSRAQCKLSHILHQRITGYIYEPNHRTIFLLSKLDFGSTTLKGFILPYDVTSDMPKFELPRPQALPPLPLNNNVTIDDIIVTYNLIYCHCLEAHITLMIDCWTDESIDSIEHPISPSFFESGSIILEGKPDMHIFTATATAAAGSSLQPSDGSSPSSDYVGPTASEIIKSYWQSDDNNSIHTSGEYTSDVQGNSSNTPSPPSSSQKEVSEGGQGLGQTQSQKHGHGQGHGVGSGVRSGVGSGAVLAVQLYSQLWQIFPGSACAWVWDPSTLSLWRVRCHLPSLVRSSVDVTSIVRFLSCRGLTTRAPRPVSTRPVVEDELLAKSQMLLLIRSVFKRFPGLLPTTNVSRDVYVSASECDSIGSDNGIGGDSSCPTGAVLPDGPPHSTSSPPVTECHRDNTTTTATYMNGKGSGLVNDNNVKYEQLMVLLKCFLSIALKPYINIILDFKHIEDKNTMKSPPLPQSPASRGLLSSFSSRSLFGTSSGKKTDSSRLIIAAATDDDESPPLLSLRDMLEPVEVMHTLLPEMLAVEHLLPSPGRKRPSSTSLGKLDRALEDVASSLGWSKAVLVLGTWRDVHGRLAVSQTELLAHVLLPLLYDGSLDTLSCAELTISLIEALRTPTYRQESSASKERQGSGLNAFLIAIEPSISILLLKLLAANDKFHDITQYVQLRFFSDSVDLAMVMLELTHTIPSRRNSSELSSYYHGNYSQQEKNQLPDIGGLSEKYDMSMLIELLQSAGLDMLWRLKEKRAVVRWMLSHGQLNDAIALCIRDNKGNWHPGLVPPQSVSGVEFFTATVDMLENIRQDGKKVEIMYTVCRFLGEWDQELITIDKSLGRSKLAALALFPEKHFNARHTDTFKEILGYK
eukprot:gene1633-3166_t